jgi:hypothetical protein
MHACGSRKAVVGADLPPCPCGCGVNLSAGVAERERRVRADTAAGRGATPISAARHRAIVLLSGMPGAGKSAVARILVRRFDRGARALADALARR